MARQQIEGRRTRIEQPASGGRFTGEALDAAAVGDEEPQIEAVLADRINVEPLRHVREKEKNKM